MLDNKRVECQIGATLEDLKQFCLENGLHLPIYIKDDLKKPLWSIINENGLSLAQIIPNIYQTESILTNGRRLFASPDSPNAYGEFDLKKLLLLENENLSMINKLILNLLPEESTTTYHIRITPRFSDQITFNAMKKNAEITVSKILEDWSEEAMTVISINKEEDSSIEFFLKFGNSSKQKV